MRGTFVGNVKKHINCDVNGKIIGDIFGNINGNMNGEIRGNVFGTISRNVNGKIKGDIMRKSNIVGDINGQIEGNILGKQSEKKLKDLGGWGITPCPYLLKVKKEGVGGRCEMLLLPYILVSTVSKVFTVNNDIRKALTNGYKVMTGCIKIVTFGDMNDV